MRREFEQNFGENLIYDLCADYRDRINLIPEYQFAV